MKAFFRTLSRPVAPGITLGNPLGLGVLALGLCLVPVSGAYANEELFKKVAPSTALITTARGYGTGWVVDAENRLLVTAHHVVASGTGVVETVEVVFPALQEGEIIQDAAYYEQNRAKLARKGKVVYHSLRRDMALIQVDALPDGTKALPLAQHKARVAQEIHVIGLSARKFGGMFSYSRGYVRGVFRWTPAQGGIVADVVSHSTPTNKGDSGGPVVNGRGEVVAFISQGTIGLPAPVGDPFHAVQVTDNSICVTEIRKGLEASRRGPVFAEKARLTKQDPLDKVRKGCHSKIYFVKLMGGDYVIDLMSGNGIAGKHNLGYFDTYLRLEDVSGKEIKSDDDGGDGRNSRIRFAAPPGCTLFRLVVTSCHDGATGDFELRVRHQEDE